MSTMKMPMMLDLLLMLSDKILVMLCEFVVVGGGWLAVDTHIGFYWPMPTPPPPKTVGYKMGNICRNQNQDHMIAVK